MISFHGTPIELTIFVCPHIHLAFACIITYQSYQALKASLFWTMILLLSP